MSRRGLLFWISAPLLAGLAVALIAGALSEDRPAASGERSSAVRNVYSPGVRSDPYFLEQQRRNVQTLELRCREAGEFCQEAAAGRQWLERSRAD